MAPSAMVSLPPSLSHASKGHWLSFFPSSPTNSCGAMPWFLLSIYGMAAEQTIVTSPCSLFIWAILWWICQAIVRFIDFSIKFTLALILDNTFHIVSTLSTDLFWGVVGVGDYFRVLVICRGRGRGGSLTHSQNGRVNYSFGEMREGWHIITVPAPVMPNVCIIIQCYQSWTQYFFLKYSCFWIRW